MKRSLIIRNTNGSVNVVSFDGGASTYGQVSSPKKTESKEREIYRECLTRSRLSSFVRSL